MIYHLFDFLTRQGIVFPFSRLFTYVSFRVGLAVILALLISTILGSKLIKYLQRKQIGELVRDLGLEGEQAKKGTPTMGGIIIILGIIWMLLTIFVFNPLNVGVQKFFIENHYSNPRLSSLLWAFKTSYANIVKTMFLMHVYLFLWSLLFAIPGIIKGYAYRLVPFILADNPDMDPDDAITLSREMMNGQKFDAFVLDLSFILWWLLSGITFNIAGIFSLLL